MVDEWNWARNLRYSAGDLATPTSVDELRSVLQGATAAKALGSRHSFNTVADTTGTLIATHALDVPIELDSARRSVRVAAGARYGELSRWLDSRGWALANLASLPHISVGGAISTGTHGSGIGNRSLAAAVNAVELMTADGELRRYQRGDLPFPGAVVSLGALGVQTAVDLDIEPRFEVAQTVYENVLLDDVAASFEAIQHSAYSVSLFTTLREPDLIDQVWLKVRTDHSSPLPDVLVGRAAPEARHPLPGESARSCTEQGGAPGGWLDRLPHFRLEFTPSRGDELQTEYLMPVAHAAEALAALRSLADRVAPVLQVCEVRTVAADDLWLSPAFGRDAVALHFTWLQEPNAVAELLPLLEEAFAPFGARPHWGKLFSPRLAERVDELFPRWAEFAGLRRELDPTGVFLNDYLRALPL